MPFSARQGFFGEGRTNFIFPTWNNDPTKAEYLTEIGSWSNSSVATGTLRQTNASGATNKYSGGIGHPNGNIYFTPGTGISNAKILEVQPTSAGLNFNEYSFPIIDNGNVMPMGGATSYKTSNIYLAPNTGTLLGGKKILEYDPVSNVINTIGTSIPNNKYRGAFCLPSGNIMFQPINNTLHGDSGEYIKLNPDDGTFVTYSNVTTDTAGVSDEAHFGGCVAFDGRLFVCPQKTTIIKTFDESSNTWSTFGTTSAGGYAGMAVGNDGKIVGVPGTNRNVLIIDPDANTFVEYTATALGLTDLAANSGHAYSGAVTGSDGRVYSIPYDQQEMLIVDTEANTFVTTDFVGFGGSFSGFAVGGCATTQGKIYTGRQGSNQIMEITTNATLYNPYGSPYDNRNTANTTFTAHISHSFNSGIGWPK